MKLLSGVFGYRNEFPVKILEVMDFEDKMTRDNWWEIVNAAINGRIDYNSDFYQRAYVSTVKLNEKMSDEKKWNTTEVHYKYDDTDDNSWRVNINSITSTRDAYESVEVSDEIRYALEDIKALQRALLYQEGINLKLILQSALEGIPTAVVKLKELCSRFQGFSSSVEVILKQQVDISAL